MSGEGIFGMIIMVLCGFGCGGVFYGIGIWAQKRKEPMHFYSGTTVDPRTISDVAAYNRANAGMWKTFSIPFWLMGLAEIAGIWVEGLSVLAIVFLMLGCTVGIGWLVWKYHRICRDYVIR